MKIFPAIDIKDNKCVRLSQGDFNETKVYSDDPYQIALKWQDEGAEYIHLVNLDGASHERFSNLKVIRKIAENIDIPIQVGGGIRSEERAAQLLDMGVDRIILGTVAIENIDLVKRLVEEYGSKVAVSIDARDGKVATRAWKHISDVDALTLSRDLEEIGVKTLVYTDIEKDGMLDGPNLPMYERISENTSMDIIASGGVSTLEDVKKLEKIGVYGAIIGKALYEEKINLKEVIECLK